MNHFFIQVENTHPQIYENTPEILKIMSRSSYRSTKKNTRTLSKIEQTILEEEKRKQARSKSYQPSLSVKKQDHKKRYRKSNNHRPVIIQTKIQTQKREKRETTKQDDPKIRFNPKFRKMSWIEIEETPDEEYQGLWMIDSDNEEE